MSSLQWWVIKAVRNIHANLYKLREYKIRANMTRNTKQVTGNVVQWSIGLNDSEVASWNNQKKEKNWSELTLENVFQKEETKWITWMLKLRAATKWSRSITEAIIPHNRREPTGIVEKSISSMNIHDRTAIRKWVPLSEIHLNNLWEVNKSTKPSPTTATKSTKTIWSNLTLNVNLVCEALNVEFSLMVFNTITSLK